MRGDELRLPHAKGDALIRPFLAPEAGAGHDWMALPTRILDHRVVAGSHQGKLAAHLSLYRVHHSHVERLLRAVAEDQTDQMGNMFGVRGRRPALNESLTE